MKLSKWVVLVLVLVPMISNVGYKPAQSTDCPPPVGYQGTDAMVLAEYQVWHGLPSHRCAFSGECLRPNKRPYDSRDREVIIRHIQEAKARGISGFVVDWYGPRDDVTDVPGEEREFQDDATKILFEEAVSRDFYVALMYDDQTVKYAESDPDKYESRVKSDLQYAEQQYFASPAYLQINERPALFIFPDDEVKPHLNWSDIRNHLSGPVTLIDRDPNPEESEYDDDFDGFFAWVTATNGQWDPDGQEWGEEYLEWFYATMQSEPYVDKVAVGGVWPGFDDSLAPWGGNRFIARKGTDTHDQTLTLAEDNNVEYIMVGTWNDFEEGTDIEYDVHMRVDMEKQDPELLIRSTPVLACWSPDIGSVPLQVYTGHELIYDEEHSPDVYLSLTPDNIYELKIWTSGSSTLSKWIKIRRVDPVPDVVPVVVESKTITVTSPNCGERWAVDSQQAITWTSTGSVENVKIQYSLDNGCNWFDISSSTENDGSFPWTVPDMVSDQCLIQVRETDDVTSDTSDVFTIVPAPRSLTLRSPNGGEGWTVRTAQAIKWSSTGDINYVTLDYSRDNGTTWKTIAQTTTNDGYYFWGIPNTVSDKCLVRVTANDGDMDPNPSDTSDAVFSIVRPTTPTLEVTAPNGGEQLVVGSRFTITWDPSDSRGEAAIEFSLDNGLNWMEIFPVTENDGKYDWIIPDEPSETCLVRISETDGDPSDVSDAVFSIVSPVSNDITVTSPNGGENWEAGSTQEITWACTGDINNVTIKYSLDNRVTWKKIVQTTPNDGSFEWTVPDTASDECLVRVTSNDGNEDPKPSDVSDGLFSIVFPSSPTIRVTAPNGGEQLVVGTWTEITWFATNSRAEAKIEYSINGGDSWTDIAGATENDGSYDWTIPDEPSETCLIKVSETGGQPVDISDAVFSIVSAPTLGITVTAPNGGESCTAGSVEEITWTENGEFNNVTIEHSTDNGTTWQMIVETTPNNGSYDWTVPETVSDECLVRVMANDDDMDPKPSDVSDGIFSIVQTPAGELRVTAPNGGESWEVGSTHSITWTGSGNITDVTIDYSMDNGNTWSTVFSSMGNDGSFDWTVPFTVSDECLVRVTGNDGGGDPIPSDVSDSVFSTVLPSSPVIRVITPNGGEQAVIGTVYKITWFATDSRAESKIEYSIDGGQSWAEITGVTENDGDYDWLVPDEPSETCLVRVSDTSGQPVDISDAVFSIVSPQTGDLTVLTPNGGETLAAGSEYNITWSCSDLNNVVFEFSANNGGTWDYINTVPADNGNYPWTVPGTPSTECLIRISGADSDENPVDVSDQVFTIEDPAQDTIEVFTPNGGESLTAGEEYYITWGSSGINNVVIEYSTNNGEEWILIDTVSAIGGRFTWTVPDKPSESCLVRIRGDDSPEAPSDVSDAVFSITSN